MIFSGLDGRCPLIEVFARRAFVRIFRNGVIVVMLNQNLRGRKVIIQHSIAVRRRIFPSAPQHHRHARLEQIRGRPDMQHFRHRTIARQRKPHKSLLITGDRLDSARHRRAVKLKAPATQIFPLSYCPVNAEKNSEASSKVL